MLINEANRHRILNGKNLVKKRKVTGIQVVKFKCAIKLTMRSG